MVIPCPCQLLRVMFGFMTLYQPGTGLMFVATVATEGYENGQSQVSHQSPGWCLRTMMHSVLNILCFFPTELPLRARSGFLALLLPDSLLMSDVSVTIKGYTDAWRLGPCCCWRATLPQVSMQVLVACTATWSNGNIYPWLPPRNTTGFVVLPWLETVVKPQTHIATKDHLESQDCPTTSDRGGVWGHAAIRTIPT